MLPVASRGSHCLTGGEARDTVGALLGAWTDGRIKLWVTACGLRLRRARPELLGDGDYLPLASSGHVPAEPVAFARTHGASALVAVAPRLLGRAGITWKEWAGAWGDAVVELPAQLAERTWRSAITGERLESHRHADRAVLPLARLLSPCPVALLIADE